MKIKKLEFKNFNSYGNRPQVIEFAEDQGLFHIVGQNGFGKTTISEVIKFGLYGKVDGKKLKDLSNRTNKNAWVRITVETRGKEVVAESGIEPSFINLWVDGVPYDKANIRGPREYLTEELLEIPFHVFNNIISISINDFKSFLKMSAEDKRKIVDKIFGFQIINEMREVLKGQTKIVKDSLETIVRSMQSQKSTLDSSLQELDMLTKKLNEASDDRLQSLETKLKQFEDLLRFHKEKMSEFLEKEKDAKNEVSKLNSARFSGRNQVNSLAEKLKLYNNSKCPTCASDLTDDFHVGLKNDLQSALDIAKRDLEETTKLHDEAIAIERTLDEEKRGYIEKESKIRYNINALLQEVSKLKSGPKDEQLESIKNIIKSMEDQIAESQAERTKSEDRLNWNRIIEDVLGEKGLKQMALKNILPSLNAEIYQLMSEMHLDYKIVFDEEFNSTVTHLGHEISLASLSRGEMKKVDFVVLIAVIKLMKMRYPGINLLFLDEILDGLDEDSVYCVLKIIGSTTKNLNLNTFIISHISQFPNETFDYKIIVDKKNNFSNLSVQKVS